MQRTAALFGATGLVGGECLNLMLNGGHYGNINVIGRSKPARSDPRLAAHQVALDDVKALNDLTIGPVDDAFCGLGTTIAKAGSQEAFRRVDLGYVVNAARFAKQRGARHFLMVTAVGATPHSRVFYSRIKGEAEDAIANLGIESVSIFRPSLILGPRDESRLKERLAKSVAISLSFAMVGPLTKYRPIQAATIAAGNARRSCRGHSRRSHL